VSDQANLDTPPKNKGLLKQDDAFKRVNLDESQRQMVLLALQKPRGERPGWGYGLAQVEIKLGDQIEWPPYDKPTCLRCKQETPAAQLATLVTGAHYCLPCLPRVEICRGCGCTDEFACPGGCSWVAKGLCSTCKGLA